MGAATRTDKVTYGAYTIDGSSSRQLDGGVSVEYTYPGVRIAFTFVVSAASNAAMQTAQAAAVAAFRMPHQEFTHELAGEEKEHFKPDPDVGIGEVHTGFLIYPSIEEDTTRPTGGRFVRWFNVEIHLELPADLAGSAGKREATFEIGEDPAGLTTIDIKGTYTALGALNALEQADADIEAYGATIVTLATDRLPNTESGKAGVLPADPTTFAFEIVSKTITPEQQNRLAIFQIGFRQIPSEQNVGVRNVADLVDESLSISRVQDSPGNAPNASFAGKESASGAGDSVNRLVQIQASYSVRVKTDSTKVLETWWTELQLHVITEMKRFAKQTITITDENVNIDLDARSITATLIGFATPHPTSWVELKVDTIYETIAPNVIIPVWTGRPTDAIVQPGIEVRIKIQRLIGIRMGVENAAEPKFGAVSKTSGWIPIESRPMRATPIKRGLKNYPESKEVSMTEIEQIKRWRFVTPPSSTLPGGRDTTASTPLGGAGAGVGPAGAGGGSGGGADYIGEE